MGDEDKNEDVEFSTRFASDNEQERQCLSNNGIINNNNNNNENDEDNEETASDAPAENPNSPYYYSPLTDRTRLSSKGGYVDGNKNRSFAEKSSDRGRWINN